MRLSQLFSRTLRQAPADAETASHRLLLRAGMIYPVAAGVYSFLPLGWRVIRKMEQIIREEMDRAGGQEVLLAALQPLELWQQTGRDQAFGKGLFTFPDRRERTLVLGPTHEEVVTQLARSFVRSYRDLPLRPYQLQTKFRDEPRPRGGLLRVREFIMKDLYSFDADEGGLEASYQAMIEAYRRIFQRCGLPAVLVEADSGAIGGKESHEFMTLNPAGEDEVLRCPRCDYAANAEKAASRREEPPPETPLPLEEVATPGIKTIAHLARFLDVPESRTLKAVFYAGAGQVVFAAIRGDLDINEAKLKNLLRCNDMRLASEAEVSGAGLVAGSASPVGLRGIRRVGDLSVAAPNLVAGANRPDHHLRNVNYPRDYELDTVADIARAQAGQGCPRCGNPLESAQAIELGHVFKLGTFISERMRANFLDREGRPRPIIMGCYGIGVGRLLAAAVEQHHDERGIIFPVSIAPHHVYLCPVSLDSPRVRETAEGLYQEMERARLETLYDDREESAGVKFNDADLLGIPLRVVVSPRTLERESAEVKWRHHQKGELYPLEGLSRRLKATLRRAQARGRPKAP